jgi:hypothetical protein
MKWPNSPNLSTEVIALLNKRLQEFVDADSSPGGGEDGYAVQELILDLYSIYTNCVGAEDEELRQMELIFRGMRWDTEEPSLVHAQKYINRLFADKRDDAYIYLDKALQERHQLARQAVNQTQSIAGLSGAKAKHRKKNEVIAAALIHFDNKKTTYASKKEAAFDLAENFPPVTFKTFYRMLGQNHRWKKRYAGG